MTFFLFLFYSILVNDRRRLIALFVWSFSNILRPSFLLCVSHYAWKWLFGMQSFLVHSVHRLTDKCTSMMAFSYTHTHTHTHTTILLIIALNTLMLPVCDCVFSRRRLLPLSVCRLRNRKRQDVVVVAAVVVVMEQHWPTFWVMCHRHKLLLRF